MEARTGIEPVYTALQAAASPLCHLAGGSVRLRAGGSFVQCRDRAENGAGNQVRTGDLNLGKVALYQLSYARFGEIGGRSPGPDAHSIA